MKIFEKYSLGELDPAGLSLTKQLYLQRPGWAAASFSEYDSAFFAGLAMAVKPQKIVEVGVASGWGSVVLLRALDDAEIKDFKYFGVDISERFFLDSKYRTGQAVEEILPEMSDRYRLLTGQSISEAAPEIGADIDFAFIDADHKHPWATLDLLSLLTFLAPESWIALHDISLCLLDSEEHHNRGPKYLFDAWDGDKVHSVEVPSMAGAVQLGSMAEDHLPILLDILYTPWEVPVEQRFITPIIKLLGKRYGEEWAHKFHCATLASNDRANCLHKHDLL